MPYFFSGPYAIVFLISIMVVAVPVLVILGFFLISHLDSTETPWGGKATLNCPHCQAETAAQGKTCTHCGQELQ